MLPLELPAFQARLHTLLAQADTGIAIAELLAWTKTQRPGWHPEAVALSADFETLRRDELKGILSFEQAGLRRRQLNDRLLQLIGRLAEAPPSRTVRFWQKHAPKLAAVPVVLGLLAAIAEFSGYSVRDLFEKKPPVESTVLPAAPPPAVSTSGDQSPAINAPNGNVTINYGDPAPTAKDSLSKK